ncbi:MAG: hypothetical protein ACO3IB_11155, partial [Phycisphaerales bacterium]
MIAIKRRILKDLVQITDAIGVTVYRGEPEEEDSSLCELDGRSSTRIVADLDEELHLGISCAHHKLA